ncbi:MAG TPA: PilZ domain-containing protein [Bdellovibrionales bacterium]|nr:PilZ domain-containing protein [Bdellovibrionales bacterium]
MADGLRNFVQRSPRYVLRPTDRNVMRFGLKDSHGGAHTEDTLLVNLSESGLAFLVPNGTKLEIGERIMVEIPIPGGEQLAWWARVIRMQLHHSRGWFSARARNNPQDGSQVMVGLAFEPLPPGHSRALKKGIEKSFLAAMREQRQRNLLYYKVLLTQNILPLMGYVILTLLAFGFLYYISLPDENYDAKRGAPWGQRFKF